MIYSVNILIQVNIALFFVLSYNPTIWYQTLDTYLVSTGTKIDLIHINYVVL